MKTLALIFSLTLLGCSATTSLKYTLGDGSTLELRSAKSQAEERANWKLFFAEGGKLASIDLGTKNTVPVNMTAETLNTLVGLIPTTGGVK